MKRREFLGLGVAASAGWLTLKALKTDQAWAADKKAATKKIEAKDIVKEVDAQAKTLSYCEKPSKTNKACPSWKDRPGHCKECRFYNTDHSEGMFKGHKYARCMLFTDPSKPQFVSDMGYCSSFTKLG
jgi:hypothetical protein